MEILNLTQHLATNEQVAAGVYEPEHKDKVKKFLTFNEIPSKEEIKERARLLTGIAISEGADSVMIGGAPYLMGALELELKSYNIKPLYSFTKREVIKVQKSDEVIKQSVFKHIGFIEV